MCTALSFGDGNRYFGRNLDLERHYDEQVVITPRGFELNYRYVPAMRKHLAFIGMATVINGYPLYYDAVNECGLGIAGLNFVGNAAYFERTDGKDNITQFELIPWILGQCRTVCDARKLISRLNLTDEQFSPELPLPSLHWLLADTNECAVLEIMSDGIHLYENDFGVLTNNPPFDFQVMNLNMYLNLTSNDVGSRFSDVVKLDTFSRGMGAIGLPGDFSSVSRFVRVAFVRANACVCGCGSNDVSQFFHILSSVEQVEGCVRVGDAFERTQYSSCCDTAKGVYYYKTYFNSSITAVDMHSVDLDGFRLSAHDLVIDERVIRGTVKYI